MTRSMMVTTALVALAWGAAPPAAGQSGLPAPAARADTTGHAAARPVAMAAEHAHGAPVAVITYAELQRTAELLAAARQATGKYQDVQVAEAAGYRATGPNVPGMGTHYVRHGDRPRFSITDPPILLYERDATMPSGLRLVGVSYLFIAPSDADGQPANPPFPKALATWHKHNNICVLPDNSASATLTEAQCRARGGRFTAETSWLVHAWIWKDSPAGVFSPMNPLVQ